MASLLEQLRAFTTVVSDTGDFNAIQQFRPQDATTNPSLIAAASEKPEYAPIVDDVLKQVRKDAGPDASDKQVAAQAFKPLEVAFGRKILDIIPGRVSTEVDARLSYDTDKSIAEARAIIALYDKAGISRDRVLIKLASTWEGIRAAEVLEKEGIHCNMTLLFGLHQAIACAEAKATSDLPLRRSHSRLVQEGHRQGLRRCRRPRRPLRHHHLQLLQEIWLQDRRHGRELPQHRRDHRTRRLRPAHHRAQTADRARNHRGPTAAQARSRQCREAEHREDHHGQGDLRQDARPDRMAHDKLKEGIEGFSKAIEDLETMMTKRLSEISEPAAAAR